MKVDVHNMAGEKIDTVELPPEIFEVPVNVGLMHQAFLRQRSNARQVGRKSKTRAEKRGGGAKPWRQKGTGRARVGYLRNPSRVHGSKAFGPKSHKYEKKVNRKVKVLARKSILSQKFSSNNFMVIEEISLESSKTKEFLAILKNLNIHDKKVTILVNEVSENLLLGSRNIKNICVIPADSASAYDLLDNQLILVDLASIELLNKQLAN